MKFVNGVLTVNRRITNKLILGKQELFKYKINETTKNYPLVSTKNLSAIKNPLDSLLTGDET